MFPWRRWRHNELGWWHHREMKLLMLINSADWWCYFRPFSCIHTQNTQTSTLLSTRYTQRLRQKKKIILGQWEDGGITLGRCTFLYTFTKLVPYILHFVLRYSVILGLIIIEFVEISVLNLFCYTKIALNLKYSRCVMCDLRNNLNVLITSFTDLFTISGTDWRISGCIFRNEK